MEEMKKSSYLWIDFSWNSLIKNRAISGLIWPALFSDIAFVTISTIDAYIQFFLWVRALDIIELHSNLSTGVFT